MSAPRSRDGMSTRSVAHSAPSGGGPDGAGASTGQSPSTIAARPPSDAFKRCDGRAGGAETLGGDGIGRGSQHCRDGRLVAGAHPDQIRQRTEKSCAGEVSLQPGGAVLAVEADRKRLDAGAQRRDVAFGASLTGLKLGDAFVGEPQRGHRPVVVLVEPDLACIELTDAALHRLELGLRLLRAVARLFDALRQPRDGLVDGLDAGTHRVDLAGEPGQPFAAVGFGAHRRQVCAFGLGGDPLAFGQLVAGRGQPLAGLGQLGEQLPLVCGDLVGLGLQRFRVGPAGRLLLGVEVLGALAGDTDRRADPFGQRRQPEPALLGGLGALAEPGDRRLVGVEFDGGGLQAGRSSRRVRGAAPSRPGWCPRIRLCA